MNHRSVSEKTVKRIFTSAIIAMIIVALSSAILSFEGLQSLALASRVPPELAFLFPITVDTTILMGSLAVLLYELFGMKTIFGWFTVLFGTALSVVGNVISVSDGGLTAQVLHGIIPILLCISLESLLRILRFNIKRSVTQNKTDITPVKDTEKGNEELETKSSSNAPESIVSAPNTTSTQSSETVVEPRQIEPQQLPQAKEEVVETVVAPKETESVETLPNPPMETPIYDTTPQSSIEENEKELTVTKSPVEEQVSIVKPEETKLATAITEPALQNTIPDSLPAQDKDISQEKPSAHLVDNPVQLTDKVVTKEKVNEVAHSPSQPKAKTSVKKVSTGSKNASSLSPNEREKFRVAAQRYLEQGHPAGKVLGEMFKVNDQMTGADIRYIMGYEPTKRVDSLVARAKKYAKGE